jgi:tetratricopeptide (TPR) repeat protein
MRRTVFAAVVVLLAGIAAGVAYKAASSDREYQRLIAAGESALAADQTSLAVEAFSGAIALRPDSMLAYLKRGETYRHDGELRAALRDLRTANSLDPTATRPLEELGDVFTALQRHDRAAERYAAYLQIDDRSPQVLYKLALAYYRGGHIADAIKPARQAISINNRFAEAHYVLGLCQEANREHRDAIRSFEQAIRVAPALTPAREALAATYRIVGRHRDAIDQLEAVAALDRERVDRLVALASAYADAGRTELAVATLGRAVERFPDNPSVFAALGEVWLRSAEAHDDEVTLNKALEALRLAVARAGGTGRALALYGRAQLLRGDSAGALRSLSEATTRLPVAPDTFRHLATAAAQQGETRQARDAMVRFVALQPGSPVSREVAYQIGEWSVSLHEPATASLWLARALDTAAPDPAVTADLVNAYIAAGQRDRAREAVENGLRHTPTDRHLLRLRTNLTGRRPEL